MKDIFKKYKKQKKISNIWVVVTSLVLAIWVNFLLIDGSSFGNTMKANVLEVKTQNEMSDIYAQKNGNMIDFYSNKNMTHVKNIALSFSYNPNNVWILLDNQSTEIIKLSDEKWIQSVIINYSQEKNISSWESLFSVETSKLNEVSEQLNIFNANFTDTSGENYLLSTSGITF